MKKYKVKCSESYCHWHGFDDELLRGENPFDKDEFIFGCPKCKGINTDLAACEIENCWEEVSCGYSTKEGTYIQTCRKHYKV